MRTLVCTMLIGISGSCWAATGTIETPQPNSPQSGVGLISGWVCPPVALVQVAFDGGAKTQVPYGTPRSDTSSACAGQINSGYGLLVNYNLLGPGAHTATVYADGAVVGTTQFTVTTLGTEFLAGAQGTLYISNFPTPGKRAFLSWQQAIQNFVIASTDTSVASVTGSYIGAIAGTVSNCGNDNGPITNNNVQFAMVQTGNNVTIGMTLPGNVPSACALAGTLQYNVNGTQHILQNGTYTCNNSTSGTWSSTGMGFSGAGFNGQATIVAPDGCTTNFRMGAARTS